MSCVATLSAEGTAGISMGLLETSVFFWLSKEKSCHTCRVWTSSVVSALLQTHPCCVHPGWWLWFGIWRAVGSVAERFHRSWMKTRVFVPRQQP